MRNNNVDDLTGGAMGFLSGLHPGIRAAVIFWLVLLGLSLLHTFTGGTTTLCYPVQLLFYIANGALAGYFALGSDYDVADLPRTGAIAGLVAWVMPAMYYLVVVVILGLATLGVGFLGIVGWLLCGPIDLAIQATCGAFGAWLYGKFSGESSGQYA